MVNSALIEQELAAAEVAGRTAMKARRASVPGGPWPSSPRCGWRVCPIRSGAGMRWNIFVRFSSCLAPASRPAGGGAFEHRNTQAVRRSLYD